MITKSLKYAPEFQATITEVNF